VGLGRTRWTASRRAAAAEPVGQGIEGHPFIAPSSLPASTPPKVNLGISFRS
jgi:hypothetical protein